MVEICRVEVWHTANDRTVTELIGSLIWPNALRANRAIESSFIEICAFDRERSNPIRIFQTLARSPFSNRANCTRRDLKAGTRLTISVSIFHRCTFLFVSRYFRSLSLFLYLTFHFPSTRLFILLSKMLGKGKYR